MNIGLLLIATRKYSQFVLPLIETIKEHFLKEHTINVYLFTDNPDPSLEITEGRVRVRTIAITPYSFPFATLYRYKIFTQFAEQLKEEDYLFYLDVDMAVTGDVGNEILPEKGLVAVSHPGFHVSKGWGSSNNPETSTSYLPLVERKKYYAGGFQGGKAESYLNVCLTLAKNIQEDEDKEIMAEWHDETHWNYILNKGNHTFIALDPSYCMVEQQELRKKWGITNLEPKIVALAKNHAKLRS